MWIIYKTPTWSLSNISFTLWAITIESMLLNRQFPQRSLFIIALNLNSISLLLTRDSKENSTFFFHSTDSRVNKPESDNMARFKEFWNISMLLTRLQSLTQKEFNQTFMGLNAIRFKPRTNMILREGNLWFQEHHLTSQSCQNV